MIFSIIIINYKTKELTANCLNSLRSLPRPQDREVILIDNASNDGSFEYLKQKFKGEIKIIKNEKNLGFAGANNQGAALAQGEIIVFLNSDTLVTEDILSDCKKIFESNKEIGIISPMLKLENGTLQPMAFGKFPNFWRIISRRSKQEIKLTTNKNIIKVPWVSGCALIITKKLFKTLEGWDNNFFLYFEDVDLCKRANDLGYSIVVNTKVSIIHLGGKSLSMNSQRKKYYYNAQNHYFKKHRNMIELVLLKIIRKTAILLQIR